MIHEYFNGNADASLRRSCGRHMKEEERGSCPIVPDMQTILISGMQVSFFISLLRRLRSGTSGRPFATVPLLNLWRISTDIAAVHLLINLKSRHYLQVHDGAVYGPVFATAMRAHPDTWFWFSAEKEGCLQ